MPKPKQKLAPAVVRPGRRFVAFGCSHGRYVDPIAKNALARFIGAFKPDRVVHLGDVFDTSCWRSGARGTEDEGDDPAKDISAGMALLEELQVTDLCMGNHDERPYRFLKVGDARIRYAAEQAVQAIECSLSRMRIRFVNKWSVFNWLEIGNFKFAHGWYYNQTAARDHAESHGNIIFGHTHRVSSERGRRIDNPRGICVGTLTDVPNMDYAKARRATLGWSQGFVWGTYNDDVLHPFVHDNGQNLCKHEWMLPPV